jgi:hypothetical protein
MITPKQVAAVSLLDCAGITHRPLEDDLVEVDCRFVLHPSNGYWREQSGPRRGYSVHELIMEIKRSASQKARA